MTIIDSPIISIIIPTFNSSKYLERCLNSIKDQVFINYEVLILDGGSTDNTIDIAKTFNALIKKLFILSEKDNGVYDAMNKGIKLSKGSWIYFLGSDDYISDNSVLKKISEFLELDYGIIYGNVRNCPSGIIYDGEYNYEKLLNKNICHQSIFFNKSMFNNLGYYNLNYKSLADYDFNLKWFELAEIKRKHVDVIIANYNEGGLSSIYFDKVFANKINLLNLKYYRKNIKFKIRLIALIRIYLKSIFQNKTIDSWYILKQLPQILF